MSKKIECPTCNGMKARIIMKGSTPKMVPCKPCKATGKIAVETGSKAASKIKKTESRVKARGDKDVVAKPTKNGILVVTRDLESGQDLRSRITEEQQEAVEAIEERAGFYACPGKVVEIRKGPVITLYEFKPAKTTRAKRVMSMHEDLALALAAEAVMIRRLPGKEAMGIEISNAENERQSVAFRASLSSVRAAKKAGMILPVNLGIDPFGDPIVDDLSAMPHLLIAGSTGSGKSVSLNCIISSMLTVCSPDEVEFFMIDPKGVELTHYEGIPHMKEPMVTTPHRAKEMLENLIDVMRMRLTLLSQRKVRDIGEYNKLATKPEEKLARVVCVIDELGDLMMQDRRAFTRLIAEISGMARATGIHMICATHRPSVDVLSGKIKVNFPARMAFRVTSAVDSKVIIQRKGAESLLGRGDMMYLSPTRGATIRIHAPWVPLVDVKAIADKLRAVEAERREKEEKARVAAEEQRIRELRKLQGEVTTVPTGMGVRRTIPHGEQETLEIGFDYLTKK